MADDFEEIRGGWYRDPTSEGQERGWKPANCSELVAYANKEMEKWVVSDPIVKGQMVALEEIPKSYEDDAPGHNEILHDDGLEAQKQLELSVKYMKVIGEKDHLMQRCRYEKDCNCFLLCWNKDGCFAHLNRGGLPSP